MTVWKKAISFLVLFGLFFKNSSGFLPDKCNIDLDPTKLFEGNVDSRDVLKGAACVGSLLKANYDLVQKFPTTHKFIENLLQQGTRAITDNPAYFGASVYITSVLVMSHYYAIDAKKQLMRAKFEQDDLNMAIGTEIIPILRFLDTGLIKEGVEKGMKKFCSTKTFFDETIFSAVDNLQKVRKNIEKKLEDSKTGEDNNGFFQKLSGGAGATGLVAVAFAPCPFTAFLACPALIAGTAGAISGVTGYYMFGSNKLTHQEAFELLDQARRRALAAEESLRRARVDMGLACMSEPSTANQIEYSNPRSSLSVLPAILIARATKTTQRRRYDTSEVVKKLGKESLKKMRKMLLKKLRKALGMLGKKLQRKLGKSLKMSGKMLLRKFGLI